MLLLPTLPLPLNSEMDIPLLDIHSLDTTQPNKVKGHCLFPLLHENISGT